MAVAIMTAIGFLAKRHNLPRETRADGKEVIASIKAAFLPLLTPIIIIGGILSGFFTPTEAAVIASLYALFLGFLYKDISLKDLPGSSGSPSSRPSACCLLFLPPAFSAGSRFIRRSRIRSFSP